MINNIINNILNNASFTLSDSKDKILAAAKKRAQEEFNTNIPNPDTFKNELNSLLSSSPSTLQEAERVYNKSTNIIGQTISKLERSEQELQNIKDKLSGIEDKFNFIDDLIGPGTPLNELIGVLKGLPLVIDGILAAQVTPIVSGTIINKAGDFKKLIKDNIQKFDDLLDSIPVFNNFFTKEIDNLVPSLNLGIQGIQSAKNQLKLLHNPDVNGPLGQIDIIWANFILALNIPELQGDTLEDSEGTSNPNSPLEGITLEEYLSKPYNLSTVVEKLILPTIKTHYEIRENGPGTQLYESGIIETPIN